MEIEAKKAFFKQQPCKIGAGCHTPGCLYYHPGEEPPVNPYTKAALEAASRLPGGVATLPGAQVPGAI